MAKIVGQIGPLTRLLDNFTFNEIDFFHTLNEIIYFENNYITIVDKAHGKVKLNLTAEIDGLKDELQINENDYNLKINQREALLSEELNNIRLLIEAISQTQKNIFRRLYSKYKLFVLNKRLFTLENNFEDEKKKPFISLHQKNEDLTKRIKYLEENYNAVRAERFKIVEEKYILARSIIEDNHPLLLGAIGEQKAVNELSKLPASYYVINDFQLSFTTPIFHKDSNSYIKSIQADHIVIGPSGLFLIETKNWSKESVNNTDLYSPIEQIKRTSFALFIFLNNPDKYSQITLQHQWGQRKITIRNILLMINNKPSQEFQYVKILTLKEILGYIQYFKPVLSDTEVRALYKELSNEK
jgi:hypothetical protein